MPAEVQAIRPAGTLRPRREHTLTTSKFTQAQLSTYAEALRAWLTKHNMHEQTLAAKIGCSGQQLRNIMKKISQPSYSLAAALFKETGIRPIG